MAYVVETEEQNPLALKTIEYIQQNYECPGFITTHTIFLETWNFIMYSEKSRNRLDKKRRKGAADYVCQQIINNCDVRMIPADMLKDVWDLYTSSRARELYLEYVDCSSIVYMRDIRKAKYERNHQLSFKGILSFNDRHFNSEFAKEFDFKVFDYAPVLKLMQK